MERHSNNFDFSIDLERPDYRQSGRAAGQQIQLSNGTNRVARTTSCIGCYAYIVCEALLCRAERVEICSRRMARYTVLDEKLRIRTDIAGMIAARQCVDNDRPKDKHRICVQRGASLVIYSPVVAAMRICS